MSHDQPHARMECLILAVPVLLGMYMYVLATCTISRVWWLQPSMELKSALDKAALEMGYMSLRQK